MPEVDIPSVPDVEYESIAGNIVNNGNGEQNENHNNNGGQPQNNF